MPGGGQHARLCHTFLVVFILFVTRSNEIFVCACMRDRTETVVEKLLAGWLSVCMYDSLRQQDAAGRALYLLYHAVKRQTDKAPVDAVTAESRYCLSEDRLLRHKVAYTTLVMIQLRSFDLLWTCCEDDSESNRWSLSVKPPRSCGTDWTEFSQ